MGVVETIALAAGRATADCAARAADGDASAAAAATLGAMHDAPIDVARATADGAAATPVPMEVDDAARADDDKDYDDDMDEEGS